LASDEKSVPRQIAAGHDTDPGQHGISRHEVYSQEGEDILLMQDVPQPGRAPEALGRYGVEQIVQGYDGNAQARQKAHGKVNQPGKSDHRKTNSRSAEMRDPASKEKWRR
jgi:hypothetical protein